MGVMKPIQGTPGEYKEESLKTRFTFMLLSLALPFQTNSI
jgi:hypothetical protein